jgi:hypothetical protein
MKGLPRVVVAPARNVTVPLSVIGGTEFGKGDGKAMGVPIVAPPLNTFPDAVTPNAQTAAPATPDFGNGDFTPEKKPHSSYLYSDGSNDPDNGHRPDGTV